MENKSDAQFRDVFQAILQLMTPPVVGTTPLAADASDELVAHLFLSKILFQG